MGEAVNLAGVIVGICVSAGGAAAWVFSHDRRLAVLERERDHFEKWLGRVEAKLDRTLER